MSFPGDANGKEYACNAGDPGSIPRSGRSPGEGNGNPFQYSCLDNSMGRGAWRAIVQGSQRVGHDWVTNTFNFHFLETSSNWPCGTEENFLKMRLRSKLILPLINCWSLGCVSEYLQAFALSSAIGKWNDFKVWFEYRIIASMYVEDWKLKYRSVCVPVCLCVCACVCVRQVVLMLYQAEKQ